MATILEIARFVRDTDSSEHDLPSLQYRFGNAPVSAALKSGYICRQQWGGEESDFVDLTLAGETALCAALPIPREIRA